MKTENCGITYPSTTVPCDDFIEVPYNPYPNSPVPYIPYTPVEIAPRGWECPRCCTINAPWMSTCQSCADWTGTTTTIYYTNGNT